MFIPRSKQFDGGEQREGEQPGQRPFQHDHRADTGFGNGLVIGENGQNITPTANTGSAGSHGHTIPAQGGGQPHSTMPPRFSLGLLIKS